MSELERFVQVQSAAHVAPELNVARESGSEAAALRDGPVVYAPTESNEPKFQAHRGAFGWDTATLEKGASELQFGTVFDPDADRLDVLATVRLGVGERTELFADLLPYQLESQPGPDADGVGDVVLGVRHRFLDQNHKPSAAVLVAAKLPTGDESEGLSSGQVDYFGALSLTKDVENLATTAYYELGIIDDPAGDTELEHAVALIAEMTLADDWGVFGQVVSTHAPEQDSDSLTAGAGVSFNLADGLAWDVGVSAGLSDEAPDFELFFGLTWSLAGPSAHAH